LTSSHHSTALWLIGAVTAGLTSLYVGRLYLKTFFGTPRDKHLSNHAHESAPAMAILLIILAVGSLLIGLLWLPHIYGIHLSPFPEWLAPVLADVKQVPHHVADSTVLALMGLYTAMMAAALWFTWNKFGKETGYGE